MIWKYYLIKNGYKKMGLIQTLLMYNEKKMK